MFYWVCIILFVYHTVYHTLCLSHSLSVTLSVCHTLCMSLSLSVTPTVYHTLCLSHSLSVTLSVCHSLCLSRPLSITLSCLSHPLPVSLLAAFHFISVFSKFMFYWVYMYIILFVHHSHRLHLLYSYCHLFMLASMFMPYYTTVLVFLSVNVFVDYLCHTVCQSFLKYFSSVWHCQVSTMLSVCLSFIE